MRFLVGNRWRNTYFSESIHLVALHTAIFVPKIQLSPHTPTNPPPTACGAGAGSVARSSDKALGQDGAAGRRHPTGATRGAVPWRPARGTGRPDDAAQRTAAAPGHVGGAARSGAEAGRGRLGETARRACLQQAKVAPADGAWRLMRCALVWAAAQ